MDKPPDPATRAKAPAGWYPHPSMVNTQRYWDGAQWTDHIAPVTAAPATPVSSTASSDGGLIAAGIITALLLPIVGFIIGIVLLARGKIGPGLASMILAIVAFFFWLEALTPDPTLHTDYGY